MRRMGLDDSGVIQAKLECALADFQSLLCVEYIKWWHEHWICCV